MSSTIEPPANPQESPTRVTGFPPALRRQVRAAFIKGEGSKKSLAKRFSVGYDAVKRWAQEDNWDKLRVDYNAKAEASIFTQFQPEPIVPTPILQPVQARIAQLEKQMRAIEEAMEGLGNPDSLAKLATAYSKLFDAWQVLTATPNPGSRRSKGRPSPPAMPIPQPMAALPPPDNSLPREAGSQTPQALAVLPDPPATINDTDAQVPDVQ